MYEIEVQAEFSAAHAIMIGGRSEPIHGHNWHITATVRGTELDGDGLLVDFHLVERQLREICASLHNGNLNEHGPFRPGGTNPTAENVARYLADELCGRLEGRLAGGAHLARVRVTEAPGCAAVYYPPRAAGQARDGA